MFGPLIHAVKSLEAESIIHDHCTGRGGGNLRIMQLNTEGLSAAIAYEKKIVLVL